MEAEQSALLSTATTAVVVERAHANVPLPPVIHHSVEIPVETRVIIIGDVHGCYDEVQDLLRACDYNSATDRLVFVGDLVNKGPKSAEVVQFVRESNALCVRGNHDDAALNAYYSWKQNGPTQASDMGKYAYVQKFTPEDVAFLEQLPFTLSLPLQNAIVVHAGLVPGVALQAQKPTDMYKMRVLYQSAADDSQWLALETMLITTDGKPEPWATQWKGPTHVYFGHDAKVGLQQQAFATGLDTGCCYGRKLTACILPSRQFVSVAAKAAYAPMAN